jgi:hypothetical protein
LTNDNPAIAAALANLAAEDMAVARDAEAALGSLTGGEGPEVITQEGIQHFLWYELSLKWLTDLEDKLAVAASLARALDSLDLPRYAEICRSQTTLGILRAYDEDDDKGLAAFRRADTASGIRPPDLPELRWGGMMGWEEARALSSTAEMLELAVAGRDLVPGARGWKARQQELVRAHLSTPQVDLAGQTLKHMILTERIEQWLNARRSEIRRKLLAAIANRLLLPGKLPLGADPCPPLRWLLEQLADGVPLTQTGNLGQKFVQGAAARFGWDYPSPPRTEDELFDLHQIRRLAQRKRLARRDGRKLVLTTRGRSLLADPESLWRIVACSILVDDAFGAMAGEVLLALLLDEESLPLVDILNTVKSAAVEEGFRDARTGEPPDDQALRWAIHDTLNPCRALGLLSVGGDWRNRTYGLNDIGKATALEALRDRAAGPRSGPWG